MKTLLLLLVFASGITSVSAIVLRGGEFSVTQIDGLSCEVTIVLYTNTGSPIQPGGGILDFGDGSTTTVGYGESTALYPQVGVGQIQFSFVHTYPLKGSYKISYTGQSLDYQVLNMENSGNTLFYMEAGFILDPSRPNFSFPLFNRPPVLFAFAGETFSSAMAITDIEHIYHYSLAPMPKVVGYFTPPGLVVDINTGLVSWPAASTNERPSGEYFFSVSIEQFDLLGKWQGYITRQFQIILSRNFSRLMTVNTGTDNNGSFAVNSGQSRSIRFVAQDSSATDSIRWTLYVDPALSNNVSIIQYDSASKNRKFRIAVMSVQTNDANVRDFPYSIVMRANSYHYSQYFSSAGDVSLQYFTKDNPDPIVITGLVTGETSNVHIYPNPVSGIMYLKGLQQTSEMQLIDKSGNAIPISLSEDRSYFNTSAMPAGVYILIIKQQGSVSKLKIIKE